MAQACNGWFVAALNPELTPEMMSRIRRIEIKARRLVQSNLVGAYHSTFKGRGIAFDAVRPYEPGDDVRDIDWNVTARVGTTPTGTQPFIKRYAEERELTVLLMLDTSASNLFGTTEQQKQERAAELGAVLALAAVRNNDKVGLLTFTNQIEHYTPPRKGRNHILRLIRDLLTVQPSHKGTDLALALRTASYSLKQRAVLFLISDFLAAGESYQKELLVTSRKHDLIAVVLSDPRESSWDDAGLVTLRDAETDAVVVVDTSDKRWREGFGARAARFKQMRDDALNQAQVDRIDLPASGDFVMPLVQFFQRRKR